MTDALEELVAVRKLLQEERARREAVERELAAVLLARCPGCLEAETDERERVAAEARKRKGEG